MSDERNFESELVFANRESKRMDCFVNEMVEQGKVTLEEQTLITEEKSVILQQAGIIGRIGKNLPEPAIEEQAAVQRHANHRQKRKIIELHPELEAALTEAIESRQQHPEPKMTSLLDRPGEALAQYMKILMFVDDKRDSGEIEHSQAHEAYKPAIELFENNGIDYFKLSNATDKVVLVQAIRAIEDKLLELCPELGDEIRNLNSARGR